jgi:hypothetical protein
MEEASDGAKSDDQSRAQNRHMSGNQEDKRPTAKEILEGCAKINHHTLACDQ